MCDDKEREAQGKKCASLDELEYFIKTNLIALDWISHKPNMLDF